MPRASAAISANATTIVSTIAAWSAAGRRPDRRPSHEDTTTPSTRPTAIVAISAADLDSAPTSSARLASAAAPAAQRAGAPTADSGSSWLNRIERLHHARCGEVESRSTASAARAAHVAASSSLRTGTESPPMVTATSCPRRSPSSRVHRSRAAVESSTGSARSPSRSTTQCSSATAARSWTIRSPTRKDDGQWIDPTASPSRHGRTPSTSPRWLPRCAPTAPSCRALELVTARSAPWPTGATWSASTAISPRCRHQMRPNGPASSIVVWSDVTMPGSRNTACTIMLSPAPGRSTSAAISESV